MEPFRQGTHRKPIGPQQPHLLFLRVAADHVEGLSYPRICIYAHQKRSIQASVHVVDVKLQRNCAYKIGVVNDHDNSYNFDFSCPHLFRVSDSKPKLRPDWAFENQGLHKLSGLSDGIWRRVVDASPP